MARTSNSTCQALMVQIADLRRADTLGIQQRGGGDEQRTRQPGVFTSTRTSRTANDAGNAA